LYPCYFTLVTPTADCMCYFVIVADQPTIYFDTHEVCKSDSSHHLTQVNIT